MIVRSGRSGGGGVKAQGSGDAGTAGQTQAGQTSQGLVCPRPRAEQPFGRGKRQSLWRSRLPSRSAVRALRASNRAASSWLAPVAHCAGPGQGASADRDPCRGGGVCADCGGEQPGDSQAVGNAPGEHFAHGLRQRHPARPEFAFFIRPGGRLLLGVQLLCLVYPAYLRADTRRWPQVGQRAPGRGPQLSLLGQLPLRGAEGRLTGLIAQPRGQLPQIVPGRVTVLPDQQSRCRSSIATIATEPTCSTTSRSARDPSGWTTVLTRTLTSAPSYSSRLRTTS